MALQMARPYKHPKTGVYYFRQRVPTDLRPILGDKIVSRSLKTKDPAEAKARNIEEIRRQTLIWDARRKAPEPLPHQQIVALSGILYRNVMAAREKEPGEASIWSGMLALTERVAQVDGGLERWYGSYVDSLLLEQGVVTDDVSRQRLISEVDRTFRQVSTQQLKRAEGDYSPDPKAERFPPLSVIKRKGATKTKPLASISGLLDAYLRELQAGGRGIAAGKRWKPSFKALVAFLGHDDAARMTKADLIAWKDHRLAEGLSPKTIRDTELAAFRAVFGWAVANLHLPTNPADGVKIKVTKKIKTREQGFTHDEAAAILTAADDYVNPERGSPTVAVARRWVPWLCAHSGARITEICQLRKEDVQEENGIAFMRLTPEAGSIKNGVYRDAPLHPELIAKGFLRFVASAPAGPLFYGSATGSDVRPGSAASTGKRLAMWIRDLGIVGDVAPNHGWRHRFKTVGREAGVDERILDAICGHAGRTVGENYGEVTLKTKANALAKMPWYGDRKDE